MSALSAAKAGPPDAASEDASTKVAGHGETCDRMRFVATPLRQQHTGHRQSSPPKGTPAASSLQASAQVAAHWVHAKWLLLVAQATLASVSLRDRSKRILAESHTFSSICAALGAWAQIAHRVRAQWLHWLEQAASEEAEENNGFGLFQSEVVEAQAHLTRALAAILEEGGEEADMPGPQEDVGDAVNAAPSGLSRSVVIQRSLWATLVLLAVLNFLSPLALLLAGPPVVPVAPVAVPPPAIPEHALQSNDASLRPAIYDVYVDSASPPASLEEPSSVAAPPASSTPAETDAIVEPTQVNVTDVVHKIWSEGLVYLTHSRCAEAEELFSAALEVLDNNPDAPVEERGALVSDRAFALVCSLRYEDATKYMETQWSNITATHVLNAAGYAYFKQRNYVRAGAAFEAALQSDPFNKIMWSNLGAAQLLAGNLRGADDAMFYATDPSNTHFHGDSWFNGVIFTNVKVLVNHAMGQKADKPVVELWYDRISARDSDSVGWAA